MGTIRLSTTLKRNAEAMYGVAEQDGNAFVKRMVGKRPNYRRFRLVSACLIAAACKSGYWRRMTGSDRTSLAGLSAFLLRLEEAQIHYRLTSVRDGAIMVQVAVPGERWEIEFFADRATEIEIFRSDGSIEGADLLDRLFADHGG